VRTFDGRIRGIGSRLGSAGLPWHNRPGLGQPKTRGRTMQTTRRQFLAGVAGTGAAGVAALWARGAGAAEAPKYRLSACDWSLRAMGPEGVEVARAVGLDGLEVSAGDSTD